MVIRQINLHCVKLVLLKKISNIFQTFPSRPAVGTESTSWIVKRINPYVSEFLQITMSFVTGSTINLYLIVCAHHAFPIITFEVLIVSYATHSHRSRFSVRRLAPLPGSTSSTITYFPSPNCPHTSVCRGTLFCMKVKAALCARFCCMGRRSI